MNLGEEVKPGYGAVRSPDNVAVDLVQSEAGAIANLASHTAGGPLPYLMACDIASPKRLRRICTLMEGPGECLQYSVFLCDLTAAQLADLESAMKELMNLHEDSDVQIAFGARCTGHHGTHP